MDPLWATAQEAGVPILFHVGGEEKMKSAFLRDHFVDLMGAGLDPELRDGRRA